MMPLPAIISNTTLLSNGHVLMVHLVVALETQLRWTSQNSQMRIEFFGIPFVVICPA